VSRGVPTSLYGIINKSDDTSRNNDVCNVRQGVDNIFVFDPHGARWNPTAFASFFMRLACCQGHWHDVGQRSRLVITKEVIRDFFKLAIPSHAPFPGIAIAPVLESIILVRARSAPLHIHVRIIGEFEFDRVCWDLRLFGFVARLGVVVIAFRILD